MSGAVRNMSSFSIMFILQPRHIQNKRKEIHEQNTAPCRQKSGWTVFPMKIPRSPPPQGKAAQELTKNRQQQNRLKTEDTGEGRGPKQSQQPTQSAQVVAATSDNKDLETKLSIQAPRMSQKAADEPVQKKAAQR
jgi:hypothetical protein